MRKALASFFNHLLATFVALCLFALFALFVTVTMVGMVVQQSPIPPLTEAPLVLHVTLEGEAIIHQANSLLTYDTVDLDALRHALRQAKGDPAIIGLSVTIKHFRAGLGTKHMIQEMLTDFKQSGKPLVVTAYHYDESLLAMASPADHLSLHPDGFVEIVGISFQRHFFKRILDALGVKVHLTRTGDHKTAADMLVRTSISQEERAQLRAFGEATYASHLTTIAHHRAIDPDYLQQAVAATPVMTPQEAQALRLVSHVGYAQEANLYFAAYLQAGNQTPSVTTLETALQNKEATPTPQRIDYQAYSHYHQAQAASQRSKPKIAIIPLSGAIVADKDQFNKITYEEVVERLHLSLQDHTIQGIILLIDSPGGDAFTSAHLWHAIQEADHKKPIYAVMCNVTASGGYYIAMGARKTFAVPHTIVGSIGIISVQFDLHDMLEEHAHIHTDHVDTTTYSSLGSPFRPPTAEEQAIKERYMAAIYHLFIKRVSAHTNLPEQRIANSLAGGRIFDAAQAHQLGLVHHLGTLQDAIHTMQQELNLTEECLVVYPTPPFTIKHLQHTLRSVIGTHSAAFLWATLLASAQEQEPHTQHTQHTQMVWSQAPPQ